MICCHALLASSRHTSAAHFASAAHSPACPGPYLQVLTDAEKRQIYDLEGVEGLENHEKGGQRGGSMNPFDMFFGGGQQGGRRKGPDAQVSGLSLPLVHAMSHP